MPYIDTSVYVDIDEFHDDELIEELEERGYVVSKQSVHHELVAELYKEYITYGYTEKFLPFLEKFFENSKS